MLYYDLVRIRGGQTTIIRRRKYVDQPHDAKMKRWLREYIARVTAEFSQ